jgi:3-oxoacyl-[acyl-carrier protein] reductase
MPRLTKLSRSVKGKRVLITGCASGMGRATAMLFGDEGARVAVTDVRGEGAEEVVAAIRAAGGDAKAWALDVAQPERIRAVVAEVAQAFGGIDILVNTAGIALPTPIEAETYLGTWDLTIRVLLEAQVHLIRAALPHLRKAEHPRIVNIASTEGLGATGGNSAYAAAKHGVIGLTRSLAIELGKDGITVNAICPGPINTGMTAGIGDEEKQIYARRRTALRRYGEPEEVAHMTLSLCLPAASFVTGIALPVDGGLTVRRA